ncbi:uncharacterized protein HGUI_01606 [Hanseniaspora guilliermondii]|uniref:Uncharacterized protein n=1 Tax=Hanseniaspora guilliermondii TaxID=56406 RepID=A0A1L0FIH7_9ASCO|nr:uncharacterized protein HGUI_01606 [Hanseniaspora guilliermondii]
MQIINFIAALTVLLNINTAYSINRNDVNITENANVSSNSLLANVTSFGNTSGSSLPENTVSPLYSNSTGFVNNSSVIKNTTTVSPNYPKYSTLAGTAVTRAANTSNAHVSITAATAHLTGNSSLKINSSVDIASMQKYPPTDAQQSAALESAAKKEKREVGKAVFSSPKLIKLSEKAIEVALEKVYQKYPSLKGKINASDVTPNEDIFISVNGIGFTNNNE